MKRTKLPFTSAKQLAALIDSYFKEIESKTPSKGKPQKEVVNNKETKKSSPELVPATFTGLALHLGFASMEDFQQYEINGKLGSVVKRARLRVEAIYENKLHYYAPTGAIFALKRMGWGERGDNKANAGETPEVLKLVIIDTGTALASSEKEVAL